MEDTFEFKLRGIKGNTLGTSVRQSFMTLSQLLTETPKTIDTDIEIKYPMLTEATEEWFLDTYAIEVNLLVDTILRTIFDLAESRPIVFSSFSPEVCVCLQLKQDRYPVYFLTESGNIDAGDIRARSVQEAVHFARAWNLAGTIQRADPLLASPRLVRYCQQEGMRCGSWGGLNDDADNAKRLAKAGLDVIIVIDVKTIVKVVSDVSSGTV
ncbi:hypothetical protein AAFC00_007327 [Neodothiora populina]|uniref:GP-PDE domain-containing protein n=1 Tax=Neodothiora populina TaxID=2781224 RepID=A0ABR3PHX1_9PEZI